MARFVNEYKPVHKGISIVGREAYSDYREWSEIRDPKKIGYYTDYRRITRKVWKKISEYSLTYESGVYDKNFFYLIPQVVGNSPFIELPNGRIRSNSHTDGDMYSPIFCNLFPNYNNYCWSVDGTFVRSYTNKLKEVIDKFIPQYYFILPMLRQNKL